MSHSRSPADPAPQTPEVRPQPRLTTPRLVLREFNTEGDPPVIQELLQCREIAANTRTIPHPYPDGGAVQWIRTLPEKWKLGQGATFCICWQEDPERPLGAIGLNVDPLHEHAELGYWIGESGWGQGICSEAAEQVIAFGFEELGLRRIHAHHLARNPASGRVMEKIGMKHEGTFRRHVKKWGVFEDAVFYAILAEEYDALRDSGERQPRPPERA